ncbi:MAG: NUDIX hydrolase [Cohaesibacter sp.]|jgi:nudix-type nucleoside diphosphatase (YffH/AdpP family)|nr:NUDIX hydrolase [Cohaesibacter sp.]
MAKKSDRFLPGRRNAQATILGKRSLLQSWISIDEVDASFVGSDGKTRTIRREIHDHGQVVCVLPVDRERRVALLARQVRVPLVVGGEEDPQILEVAAGLIDAGESPEQAVLREGEEELGVRLNDLSLVAHAYSSPGSLTEKPYHFLASYSLPDRLHKGGGLESEGEDIIVEEIALDELGEAVLQGNLRDIKTILLIQHLMLSEPELFF